MTYRIVEDHALGLRDEEDLKVRSGGIVELTGEEVIEETVADHDLEDRQTLERHGVVTSPAYKDIERGIQGVIARLKPSEDGRARIFFLRDCRVELDERLIDQKLPTCTVEEFDAYIMGPAPDNKNQKEEPIDKDNHGMDAMRYAVAYVDDLANQEFELVGGGTLQVKG